MITIGSKVQTTHNYARVLPTLEAFIGVVTKDNGDTVEVATEKRGKTIISKHWLEVVRDGAAKVCPECGTCPTCGAKH